MALTQTERRPSDANPEIYEFKEAEAYKYAIRLNAFLA
jgi:hypothetical protein